MSVRMSVRMSVHMFIHRPSRRAQMPAGGTPLSGADTCRLGRPGPSSTVIYRYRVMYKHRVLIGTGVIGARYLSVHGIKTYMLFIGTGYLHEEGIYMHRYRGIYRHRGIHMYVIFIGFHRYL